MGIIIGIFAVLMLCGIMSSLLVCIEFYDEVMRVIDDIKERRRKRKHTELQKNSEKEVE